MQHQVVGPHEDADDDLPGVLAHRGGDLVDLRPGRGERPPLAVRDRPVTQRANLVGALPASAKVRTLATVVWVSQDLYLGVP
jgi:hypothetical protein